MTMMDGITLKKSARSASMKSSALLPDYAELHCMSNFSFLRGASHPQELAETALETRLHRARNHRRMLARGAVRAHGAIKDMEAQAKAAADAASKAGQPMPEMRLLKLIIGSELHLTDADGAPFCTLIALATNRAGYGNLSN